MVIRSGEAVLDLGCGCRRTRRGIVGAVAAHPLRVSWGQQFVRDAAHVLNQDGKLYLVANRFICYERSERMMSELFSRVTTGYEDNRFRVLVAEGRRR
jgi:16S rRNA G1207 methylase RsmC